MGIDQLGFQSVQLGYLKILQLGNADPNNTKAGKRVRGQASCINRGNHRSVIIRPISHHSSVVFRHNQSVGHHSDDALNLSGTTHMSAGHNVALSQVSKRVTNSTANDVTPTNQNDVA
ncbi:hypothetical protein F511_39387 [Dorcoceras hygrometricum]|uniref:Uncharacterized protein n=1 Tax=Dorcoceras hygrometricum TaxID=472368 RepID=A0A2Z7BDX0_9LAMI|nr:hypothetical protein F511_39387 [Dorcoceras hygrometricum]